MIKRFVCWAWGHDVPWNWYHIGGDKGYSINRADFCERCGRLEEEFMEPLV